MEWVIHFIYFSPNFRLDVQTHNGNGCKYISIYIAVFWRTFWFQIQFYFFPIVCTTLTALLEIEKMCVCVLDRLERIFALTKRKKKCSEKLNNIIEKNREDVACAAIPGRKSRIIPQTAVCIVYTTEQTTHTTLIVNFVCVKIKKFKLHFVNASEWMIYKLVMTNGWHYRIT